MTQGSGSGPGAGARAVGFRLASDIVWLAVAAVGVWWLRRDVNQLNDLQIQLGRMIAMTGVMMIVPLYLMNAGFQALFGLVMRRVRLKPEMLGERGPLSLLRWEQQPGWFAHVFEVAFIALGLWTVGLLAAIDLFPGIMALIALFMQVMFSGMRRLPGGKMMLGCGGMIGAAQLLLIGVILLSVYSHTPVGGDLGIGAVLAMIGPGARMLVNSGIAIVGMVRQGWPPVGAE